MSNVDQTTRFSVRVKETEKAEIQEYLDKTGMQQNELVRRATVAYIRMREGKGEDVHKLFQAVGPIDQADQKV